MDKKQLELEINLFIEDCNNKGKPVSNYCLYPAYPGDDATSYIFQIKAEWVEDCFDAIDFFTDIMFEKMTESARSKIFSIQVFMKDDVLHCDSGEMGLPQSK